MLSVYDVSNTDVQHNPITIIVNHRTVDSESSEKSQQED